MPSDGFAMSGSRYLLDTNAIVSLLKGTSGLHDVLTQADWLGISIISILEFLAFDGLSPSDIQCFRDFLGRVETVDLCMDDKALTQEVIHLRQRFHLKLPDAIIAASARTKQAALVTADRHFNVIGDLLTLSPNAPL